MSKKYNLGMTRISLPAAMSYLFKRYLQSDSSDSDKRIWALKNVGFQLDQGRSLALIGPNGAGKTTILKLLAKITRPTSGEITVNGRLSALIELGAGFHPDLTGRENIYLNGAILGLSRKDIARRFDEIVEFSELQRFIDTPVKRYSSGMAVRLGFAVASCIEPEILLIDEVLAVGDTAFQQKCLSRIRSLLGAGTSIIFVSHNLYLVQAVCDMALYIDKGQIQCQGHTSDVIARYEQVLHEQRAKQQESRSTNGNNQHSDIQITKVEVLGPKGSANKVLDSRQEAEIKVHYVSNRDFGKVNASIFIIRSDGLTCCMMRTKLDRFELALERGTGVFSVHLNPLQLIGGTYFAEAALLNESDSMAILPSPARSDWFSVKGAGLSSTNDSGVFEPKTYWSQTKQDEVAEEAGGMQRR